MNNIRLKACAKINLSLDVTGRREDGYHNIESLMQGVDMYDEMLVCDNLSPDEAQLEDGLYSAGIFDVCGMRLQLAMNSEELKPDENNLAVKGTKALAAELQQRGVTCPKDLSVFIDKRLPIAAGIAGGSGNAAGAMLGLNALAGYPLTLKELMKVGVSVGADVPFSLMMNAAMNRDCLQELAGITEACVAANVSGIGEIIEPAEAIHRYVILVNPGVAVSTKEVYEAIDALPEELRAPKGLWHNSMEAYTLDAYEEAGRLKHALEMLDAEHVLMSGSGPTTAAYYTNEKTAKTDLRKLKKEIVDQGYSWRVWFTETGKEF